MAMPSRLETQLVQLEAAVARLQARVADLETENAILRAQEAATAEAPPPTATSGFSLALPTHLQSREELRQWLDRMLDELEVCIQNLKS